MFKKLTSVALVSLALFALSCSKEETIGPAPTLALSATTASGLVGSTVTTNITITAPEGAKTLIILRNGAPSPAFPSVTLNGETSATIPFRYTIEALAPNTVVNFTFQVTDRRDRTSAIATFAVTVSAQPAKEIVEVRGNLSGNITWTKDKIYRLNGFVRVGTDNSLTGQPTATGVLTIEPGTLIIGDRETKGTLIIHRGSRIIANGTAAEPIVLTSERPAGQREPGDWGGLVICGFARNNNPGGVAELEGQYGAFHGGTNDDDNSGVLRFVRIEYAGIPINPNQEVNSLTLGSVGRGTVIENVMCSFGLDDAFEWFGGTVNAKNLIAYRGLDDDLDVDNGYSGRVQFALSIRAAALADQSGSNGFEVDNDGTGSNATPFTSAIFSNVTVIGPKKDRETAVSLQFQSAAQLRRNCKIQIHNSFFTAYPNGIFIDGANTVANATANELILRNNILAGVENWGGNGFGSAGTIFSGPPANGANHPNAPRGLRVVAGTATFANGVYSFNQLPIGGQANAETWFTSNNNTILPKWQDAGISPTLFDAGVPTMTPNTGSPLLSGASFQGLTGFENVTFRGAFGTTDWTRGWAEWNPQLKEYR
ncbi:Ig-like domain repeat protein [Rhodoflexus sp.]